MRKPLIIIGASGHMKDVAFILESQADAWELQGVLDDDQSAHGGVICGATVLGSSTDWLSFEDHWFVVAIGAPRMRAALIEKMKREGTPRFATLIHAGANISRRAAIGSGCMIGPGSGISSDARVGNHVIINANATVAHDDQIADYCTIAPQAALSGNVTLGDGVEVGTRAVVRQGTRIGTGAMVGMGAVVLSDVPENTCVVGNPARVLRALPPFGIDHV